MTQSVELTIIVPTYCERGNIARVVKVVESALTGINWQVIFVDDNSPDGTAEVVREISEQDTRVRLIKRVNARGLSGACITGIQSVSSPYVAVMDADLQHDETILPSMLGCLKHDQADLVLGTRYTDSGSNSGLSNIRSFGSKMATRIAQMVPYIKISDPMSGFFMMRRERFVEIEHQLSPQGFKLLLDILASARGKWKVVEIGYEMRSRQDGDSKMDATVTMELLALVASLCVGGRLPVRFIMFAAVGASGVVVHLGMLHALLHFISNLTFIYAQAGATLIAMIWNFYLNNRITYRDKSLQGGSYWRGMMSFIVISLLGATANLGVASTVFDLYPEPTLAAFSGILIGAIWNYGASSIITWRSG